MGKKIPSFAPEKGAKKENVGHTEKKTPTFFKNSPTFFRKSPTFWFVLSDIRGIR